jgi:hypothetical protein
MDGRFKLNETLEYQFTESAFRQQPTLTPNLKIYFGDDSNFHIQFYTKNAPNRFQRWLCYKCFGITLELLK